MSRDGDLGALEERLGHAFADRKLLVAALTHASARSARRAETYERLEFLGDRVLGLVIADMLVERFGEAAEGELARRLARLVSGEACAEVGRAMCLDRHVHAAGATLKDGGRAATGILADACEAIIGAAYRDGGLEAARAIIERYWREALESMQGPLRDAKTELQEWAHRRNLETPRYHEVGRTGPDHAPEFVVEVVIAGAEGAQAKGRSKREAEQEAAEAVLRREGVWTE
ncbi:MAG TPA: ribonuclease III [Afifellaceae bacterium]|nr:ribonuclease III [Afifellaceae bacterium]